MNTLEVPKPVCSDCACMATRHKFLASCRSCGWIACEQNTRPACACGGALLPAMTAADVGRVGLDAPAVKAYALLDKLLQFDKENAQRTHVHDAQADYYESGTWLSETEKDDIARREKARLDAKKNANGSRKINIRFDIAGRRVVDCVSEDEEEQEEEQEEGGSARPAWMLDEAEAEEAQGTKGPQKSNGAQGAQGSYATATSSEELAQEQLAAVAFSVYDNLQLEQTRGKAGDIYRTLKKKWDQEA